MTDNDPVVHQSVNALAQQVQSFADHAVTGAKLADGGLDEAEISALVNLIEANARIGAEAHARQLAMSLVPAIATLMRRTHEATAMRIHNRLLGTRARWHGYITSIDAAQAALDVMAMKPTHQVPESLRRTMIHR